RGVRVVDARRDHVAGGHVVEDAGTGDRVAVAGIAGAAAAGAILGAGELIQDRIGIALGRAGILVDQRLDAGPDRRAERRAAPAGAPAGGGAVARDSGPVVGGIGEADGVGVVPGTERREHRDGGQVAHVVGRIAEQAGLPGRLRRPRAAAADHASAGSRALAAQALATRPTPVPEVKWILIDDEAAVAETARAVGRSEALIGREQLAATGRIPRNFRNVRKR